MTRAITKNGNAAFGGLKKYFFRACHALTLILTRSTLCTLLRKHSLVEMFYDKRSILVIHLPHRTNHTSETAELHPRSQMKYLIVYIARCLRSAVASGKERQLGTQKLLSSVRRSESCSSKMS